MKVGNWMSVPHPPNAKSEGDHRAPQGWWCRAEPSAAAHALPKGPDLAGSDLGCKTWVWRGSGCRFTPTVTKVVSPVGQSPPPVSHRQIPDNISPPHMFFTHRVHYPRVICFHSRDITWSSNPEPLPMQNLFFSYF